VKAGAVNIAHNGTTKLATTGSGIDVTGSVVADDLIVTGTSVVADLKSTNNNNVLGIAGNNSSVKTYLGTDSSGNFLLATGSGVSTRLGIDAADGHITPGAAGTQDLGSISKEFRHLYLGDSGKAFFGSDQDLSVYHSDTHAFINNTKGNLNLQTSGNVWIENQGGTKVWIKAIADQQVELYYNNTLRLATTTTGITVGGEVAATQDYPTIRPIIDFNFAAVKELDPRITYYRNGTASYIDENGIVKFAPPNEPRFDHDPVTKESRGFLIEESKVNNNRVAGQEWKIATATGWSVTRMSNKWYSATAPDGSSHVALSYPSTDNDSHYNYINHAGNSYTGRRTISCWFKNLSSTIYYPQLRIFGVGSGKAYASFTLTGNGAVTSGGSSKEAATITPYPNGWYRCTLSWNHSGGHWGGGWVITNSTSTELPNFAGDSDKTKGFLVWGFQDEPGGSNGNFPTSFIPSDGTDAPADTMITPGRGADHAVIEGQHFTDLYNVSEGTFLVKASVDDLTTSNQPMWGVEKSSNRSGFFNLIGYRVGGGASGYTAAWYNNNGSTSAFVNINTGVTVGTPFVTAFGYKLNDMAASTNGSTPSTDTSASIASDGEFNRFILGQYHYDAMSVGHIQRAVYYRQRLTNAQLKNITS